MDKKVSEGIVDVGLMQFPGPKGTTCVDEFSIKWEMEDTEENRKIRDDFLKQYPTRESYLSG